MKRHESQSRARYLSVLSTRHQVSGEQNQNQHELHNYTVLKWVIIGTVIAFDSERIRKAWVMDPSNQQIDRQTSPLSDAVLHHFHRCVWKALLEVFPWKHVAWWKSLSLPKVLMTSPHLFINVNLEIYHIIRTYHKRVHTGMTYQLIYGYLQTI